MAKIKITPDGIITLEDREVFAEIGNLTNQKIRISDRIKVDLIACGVKVRLIDSHISGIITSAIIRYHNIDYEISYFDSGSERRTIIANECEFYILENAKENEIGFNKSSINH